MIVMKSEMHPMDDVKNLIAYCRDEAPYDYLGGRDLDAFVAKMSSLGDILQYRSQGRLMGFIAYYANDPEQRFAFINMLCVAPEARRSGLGKLLVGWCRQITLIKGFPELRLEVHDENDPALKLYGKLGFEDLSAASSGTRIMRLI